MFYQLKIKFIHNNNNKSIKIARIIHSKIQTEELEELVKSYNNLNGKNDVLNEKLFYLFDYEIDHLLIG